MLLYLLRIQPKLALTFLIMSKLMSYVEGAPLESLIDGTVYKHVADGDGSFELLLTILDWFNKYLRLTKCLQITLDIKPARYSQYHDT